MVRPLGPSLWERLVERASQKLTFSVMFMLTFAACLALIMVRYA